MFNDDLKQAVFSARLKWWEVADKIGVHPVTLSNWLRHELTPEKKKRVLKAIDELMNEKQTKQ